MNDPWDVKSVRQPGQYVSCMKINGVPLLPPVLSKECRKEMQYYKLLAKEVEKRISVLQPYIAETDSESEDKTDAPELPENEQLYELPQEGMQDGYNVTIHKTSTVTTPKTIGKTLTEPHNYCTKIYNGITSNILVESIVPIPKENFSKSIDLSLKMNDSGKNNLNKSEKTPLTDMPERDYNCVRKNKDHTEKELLTEIETPHKKRREGVHFAISHNKDGLANPISDFMMTQDGPSSLSSKSFTGSLNDLHSESIKDGNAPLIRQSSYTLLKPSPQLLAHLEVQSLNTGIEMQSISMSESLSNLSTPRKRRSWDLETAKVKWSSMAMELKQKNVSVVDRNQMARSMAKKSPQMTPSPKARSVIVDRTRRSSVTLKVLPKSDPLPKTKKVPGPISVATNRAVSKEPTSPTIKEVESLPQSEVPALDFESPDPATHIRDLYEKIQKQQLIQMASLVEKQKREQILLHQVFEEQNNLLFKQLKTICPKSPIEVQEAWGDKHQEVERGPVSLSQLINQKSPDHSLQNSPVSSTLTDTNNYINHCDNVLKKSRDITGSIKKQQTKSRSQNGTKVQSPRTQPEGNRTRTHSPNQRPTFASRKLNYDTSASSDREYEPILTDRTNDTMADLNVTFPSDSDGNNYSNKNIMSHLCGKEMKISLGNSGHTSSGMHSMFTHTDSAIRSMERTIQNSINNTTARHTKSLICSPPTAKQRAAATKIVAVAKGYLVRRLMRTERVQATVQTIKDALLCALQLHQDREGIRGADVDLHRRLIQQITAACYSLHDTFVASTPADRCAMISADRGRRRSLANRPPPKTFRPTDIMSQSHTGAFPARAKRSPPSAMTQSNYETFSGDKSSPLSRRHLPSPRRRPWR